MKIGRLMLVAGTVLSLSGCYSHRMHEAWDPAIGRYKYDDAVLKFGPPRAETTTTAGGRVAEWDFDRDVVLFLDGRWQRFPHNERLILRFDANGVMNGWQGYRS